MNTTPRTHVLVVGGGFAGGTAATRIARRAGDRVRVTLVNPRPTFVNRLRLHRAAVGQQMPAPGLRHLLGPDVTFVEGWVTTLDPETGRASVTTPDGVRELAFDRVVLAAGSTTEPVPVPGGEHAHGVGDLDAALRLREAFRALPPGSDVAVVGGGFTGLETVGELAEARPDLRVRLVASGEVGAWFAPRARQAVLGTLRGLGVETLGGTRVTAVEADRVLLDDGAEVPSGLTVWCGGFAAPPLAREAGLAVDAAGAAITDDTLRSVSHPQVLVAGDAAHVPGPGGRPWAGSCQLAYPTGAHAGDVVTAQVLGRLPDGARPPALDFGYVARCVSLGSTRGIVSLTTPEDVATDRSATGRAGAAVKRFQLWGTGQGVGLVRRFPGVLPTAKLDAPAVAGAPSLAG